MATLTKGIADESVVRAAMNGDARTAVSYVEYASNGAKSRALLMSIVHHSTVVSKILVRQGADLDEDTLSGAVRYGCPHCTLSESTAEIVSELRRLKVQNTISNGISDATPKRARATPEQMLIGAIQSGDPIRVTFALRAGANPHSHYSVSGEFPIGHAAQLGIVEVMVPIIDAKVDLDTFEPVNRTTALMYAARNKHAGAASLLKDSRASLHMRDIYGQTAHDMAESLGYAEIADMLRVPEKSTEDVKQEQQVGISK